MLLQAVHLKRVVVLVPELFFHQPNCQSLDVSVLVDALVTLESQCCFHLFQVGYLQGVLVIQRDRLELSIEVLVDVLDLREQFLTHLEHRGLEGVAGNRALRWQIEYNFVVADHAPSAGQHQSNFEVLFIAHLFEKLVAEPLGGNCAVVK